MRTIGSAVITIALFLALKTRLNHGMAASPHEYLLVIQNTRIAEYSIWIALALSFTAFRNASQWYSGSFSTSRSTRLMECDDGSHKEMVVEGFSATSDYGQAKMAYRFSVLALLLCIVGSVAISFFFK